MLCLIKAGPAVAVVGGGDDHAGIFLKEQAEGNFVQHRLPPAALLNLDFARGRSGILGIIAVLSVADRADRLFKVARLTVVYAAVVGANIVALGALAVRICVLV